jgi:hypothetical protein
MEFPLWSLQESEFYRETQHDGSHWPTRVSWTVGLADDDDDDDTQLRSWYNNNSGRIHYHA